MSLSDPQRPPNKTPRRAEPLQPDRPGRGDDRLERAEDPTSGRKAEGHAESTARRVEQSETALDNVRNP